MFSVSNKLTRSTWEIRFQLQTTRPKRRHRYLLTFFITNFSQIQHFVLAVLFLTIHNYFSFYLEHLNTYETTFTCILVVETYVDIRWPKRDIGPLKHIRWRSLTIFDSFHFLTIATKSSNLDPVGILHPTLITDIFTSQSWVLINLKPISPQCKNWSANCNEK